LVNMICSLYSLLLQICVPVIHNFFVGGRQNKESTNRYYWKKA
jgi:hypothetical protein